MSHDLRPRHVNSLNIWSSSLPAIWCGRLAGAQAVQYFPQVPMWVEFETTPCLLLSSCHLSPQTYRCLLDRCTRSE